MKKSIYTIVIVMILLFLITLAGCMSRQSPNTYSSDTFQKPQYTESSCFQFSNIEAKTLYPEHPSLSVYQVTANVKNTCMENFDHVCIKLTYYDSDNMVVTTKMYEIAPFQHGLTKGVNFILGPGTGLNQPVRQQFNAFIVNPGQGYLYCI